MVWGIEDKAHRSVPWQLSNLMNFHLLFETDFQQFILMMFLAFLVAVAVAEILAQRKHRLALQALRTGRDIQKGGQQ